MTARIGQYIAANYSFVIRQEADIFEFFLSCCKRVRIHTIVHINIPFYIFSFLNSLRGPQSDPGNPRSRIRFNKHNYSAHRKVIRCNAIFSYELQALMKGIVGHTQPYEITLVFLWYSMAVEAKIVILVIRWYQHLPI